MIRGLDHIALTVQDMEASIAFYGDRLGGEVYMANEWRRGESPLVTVVLGTGRINLHPATAPVAPHAQAPTPGAQDFCFRWDGPLTEVRELLESQGIAIEHGPVSRPAADGEFGESLYCRDPDGNLIEFLSTDV